MEPAKEQLQAREMFIPNTPYYIFINEHRNEFEVSIHYYVPDSDGEFIRYFDKTLREAEFRAKNLSNIFGLEIMDLVKRD